MSALNINEIIDLQILTLNQVQKATYLIEGKANIQENIINLFSHVSNLETDFNEAKLLINDVEDKILELQNTLPLLQKLEDSYSRLNNDSHIVECIRKNKNSIISDNIKNNENYKVNKIHHQYQQNSKAKNESNSVEKSSKHEITIYPLNQEEFDRIPKYIIGRNTLPIVNNFISTLNLTLQKKYTFMALGKLKAKQKNLLEKFSKYKSQNTSVTLAKGYEVYFFTEEDYQSATSSKLDKLKLNFLTALRHVKRIEVIKIGKDVYYAMVDN